jgi:hypothetical protein
MYSFEQEDTQTAALKTQSEQLETIKYLLYALVGAAIMSMLVNLHRACK